MTVLAVTLLVAGCATQKKAVYKPAPLTAEEREELQMRILEGGFDAAFAATIAILQDEGWNLEQVNKESGIIQATTAKRDDTLGPADDWKRGKKNSKPSRRGRKTELLNKWTRWESLTAHIEPWGQGKVRERISVVKNGSLPAVTYSYNVGSFSNRKVVNVNAPAKEEQAIEDDAVIYGKLFTRIKRAMTARQHLR
jgi:hypothetical protein